MRELRNPFLWGVATLLLGSNPFPKAFAQEPDRVVTVEKEYNPEVGTAQKITTLPKSSKKIQAHSAIEYGQKAVGYQDSKYRIKGDFPTQAQLSYVPGYLNIEAGNYGLTNLGAGYFFKLDENSELNVSGSFKGENANVDLNKVPEFKGVKPSWDRRNYKTDFSADYVYRFSEVILSFAAQAGADNFNYYRFEPSLFNPTTNQNFQKYSVQANVESNDANSLPLQFKISTGYFSFRKNHLWDNVLEGRPLTENLIHSVADLWGDLSMDEVVGLRITMDNLFYSHYYSAYTALEANPYYNFSYDELRFHVGGKVHYNVGRGNFVQVAPDINVEYPFAEGFSIYAEAVGGHQLNDFRALELECPYWVNRPMKDAHVRINSVLGIKGEINSTFDFNLQMGYNVTKDDICFLNLYPSSATGIAYLGAINAKTKHFFAGGDVTFHLPEVVDFMLAAKTYEWDADHSAYLLMKPKNEINTTADIPILSDLKLNLGYRYVERDRVTIEYANGQQTRWKMAPINDLSVGLTLNLIPNLSLYGKVSNLLNRDYDECYAYAGKGVNFMGGLLFRF
ncbi:MAG: hypothetical protein WCQ86_00285 [Bacteroidaceae bacterium]